MTAQGPLGTLKGELQHFAYRDVADHLETIDRYTTYAARQMREAGRHAGLLRLAGHPPLAFLRNYIARGGFREGCRASSFRLNAMFLVRRSELERPARTPQDPKGTKEVV